MPIKMFVLKEKRAENDLQILCMRCVVEVGCLFENFLFHLMYERQAQAPTEILLI